MEKFPALILAKTKSERLPKKNILDFGGEPMFLTNVRKCLRVFGDVYVSSESDEVLDLSKSVGAKTIKRGNDLLDCANIPVYQHALEHMGRVSGIVAVQANSPTISIATIINIRELMDFGFHEIMTCHEDYSLYGSVWGLTKDRIKNYGDPYKQKPQLLLIDKSIDIHTKEDYNKAKSTL